jgi:hypothetical protein
MGLEDHKIAESRFVWNTVPLLQAESDFKPHLVRGLQQRVLAQQ